MDAVSPNPAASDVPLSTENIPFSTISNTEPTPSPEVEPAPQIRRSTRATAVPDRYGFSATLGRDPDHPTFAQATNGPDKKAWVTAMKDEFDSLTAHGVGTLVDPPPGANVLGGMWIFNKKRDEYNRVVRFKARWVVFGNHQIEGIDYMDTYVSP